jgi:predicted phosphodiesterase
VIDRRARGPDGSGFEGPPGAVTRRLRALAVGLVILGTVLGAAIALASFRVERQLEVATLELSVDPGHDGALDLYVPLVDWGVRFDAVTLPARLGLEVRAIDRAAARRVAQERLPELREVRADAEDAIASYIRVLALVVLGGGFAGGALVALVARGRWAPPLRAQIGTAAGTSLVAAASVALLLPPRGELSDPEYYANGPDIPVALQAIERATASATTISGELDEQLTALARTVTATHGGPLGALPRLVLASDLHDNLVALPTLTRAASGGPVLFAGDLTIGGTPVEGRLAARVARAGEPFVFVAGNHDSEEVMRRLAKKGAIVLTEHGRLLATGDLGEVVVDVGGVRVAGYSDPFLRTREGNYLGEGEPTPTEAQRRRFDRWLEELQDEVDVVVVHQPELAATAVARLRDEPPGRPLAILTGHTHEPALEQADNLLLLNGGTVGGGGFPDPQDQRPVGLAVLTYEADPAFEPLAVDMVQIDASEGSAMARRQRLDLRLNAR